MYLRDHKILYVHIPRTGGQSVTRFFYDCLGILDQFENTAPKNEIKKPRTINFLYESKSPNYRYLFAKNINGVMPGPKHLTHMTIQEFVDHGYISREEFPNLLKVATVRNPYEKIISSCNYRDVAPDWFWLDKMVTQDKNNEKYRHFMRQSDYLRLDGEIAIDNVIKIEDIQCIPALVSSNIETTDNPIEHYHKYEGKVYQRVIDREIISATEVGHIKRPTIDWINDYYHEDFERFGYEKI